MGGLRCTPLHTGVFRLYFAPVSGNTIVKDQTIKAGAYNFVLYNIIFTVLLVQ